MSGEDFLTIVCFLFQRIEVFVKQNKFLDALELALSFYNGTAMAVIGRLKHSYSGFQLSAASNFAFALVLHYYAL